MIRINLTGDYDIKGAKDTEQTELLQLEAFLGALRGSVESDSDVFLKAVADLTKTVRRKKFSNVALQITSELTGNKLTHEFRIVGA